MLLGLSLQAAREHHMDERRRLQLESDRQCVTAQMTISSASDLPEDINHRVSEYALQRQARIERFLEHVQTKHKLFLEAACPV